MSENQLVEGPKTSVKHSENMFGGSRTQRQKNDAIFPQKYFVNDDAPYCSGRPKIQLAWWKELALT